jgi:methionine synthase II (cobalamin-independent)
MLLFYGPLVCCGKHCQRRISGFEVLILQVPAQAYFADRIVRFARIVGRENVIAGTDCGFAQQETIARVHPKVMWAKFEALAAGARLATAELWGRAAA